MSEANHANAAADGHGHGELDMGHHHVSSSAMFMTVLIALLFVFTLADLFTRRLDNEMHVMRSPVDKQWTHPSNLEDGGH